MTQKDPPAVSLSPSGLVLGDEVVPVLSGSVHYFRLPRSVWKPALLELRKLGARLVDTYVPWSVHERSKGDFDFGQGDPRLDVVAFLETAAEVGLHAIVRPGPHVNAELTLFGIPERVIWDPACQARSATGSPVVLPAPPLAFPVPSHASSAFHGEAALWLRAAAEQLAPLVWPHGPIVLAQVDNEGALYFRDGPYDQDYHPDAITQYGRFLKQRYGTIVALRRAHQAADIDFDRPEPPASLRVTDTGALPRHLDWAEFQEALLESAMYRFRSVLDRHGLRRVPKMHNLPIAERATPLDPARLTRVVDLVALDYYHEANGDSRAEIAARTSHLAVRSEATRVPPFAAEMGAGFAPNLPPTSEATNAFAVLSALAYGLRGFNVYMAVQRDRWIGGPIDARGRRRASGELWARLFEALERTRFHELRRRTHVHVVFPRALDRLVRVCHAFGPLPPVVFALLRGAETSAFEGAQDPTSGAVTEAMGFLRNIGTVLDRARVAHAVVQSDLAAHSLAHSRWTILASAGALDPDLVVMAGHRALVGGAVSFGPRVPDRGESHQPMTERPPRLENPVAPLLLEGDFDALTALVGHTIASLGIPRLEAEPAGIFTTLHEDAQGKPRVLFVINATPGALEAIALAPGARRARDALSGEDVLVKGEHAVLPILGHSVRMLELFDA